MTLHTEAGFETGIYRVTRRSTGVAVRGRYERVPAIDRGAAVDDATDQFTIVDHGLETGDGPLWVTSDDEIPGGLSSSTPYWAIAIDDDNFQLAISRANAMAGVEVNLTDEGEGAIHVASYFTISADVQPLSGRQLKDLPEGQRAEDRRTLFTDVQLFSRHPLYDPDVVEIEGERWRVDKVEYFGVISGHYRVVVERMEVP